MKKAWIILMMMPCVVYGADQKKTVFNPYTGKLDFITNLASSSIGNLGTQIQIVDEGTLQGGASWFNFVGAGVSVSVSGGTATVTINGGASGGSDNMGSHVATTTLQMNGWSIQGGTKVLIGDTTSQNNCLVCVTTYSVTASAPVSFFTAYVGSATPKYDLQRDSATLGSGVTTYILGSLIQGTTIQSENSNVSLGIPNSYFARFGDLLRGTEILASGFPLKYLFTQNGATGGIVYKNTSGETMITMQGSGAHFGSATNNAVLIDQSNSTVITIDTSKNVTLASASPLFIGGFTNGTPSLSKSAQSGTGLTIPIASPGLIDFNSDGTGGRRIMGGFRNNGMFIGGNVGTAGSIRASLQIGSSSLANVGEVDVSSIGVGLPDFTVSHSSAFVGVPFLVAPSSANGFTNVSPSTYALAVASCTPFNGAVPMAPYTFSVDTRAHINSHGSNPALTACGTSTLAPWSNDNHGYVTVVGVVTSCVVTFARPFDTQADCVLSDDSTAISAVVQSPTNIGFTAAFGASLGGGHFTYHCDGND